MIRRLYRRLLLALYALREIWSEPFCAVSEVDRALLAPVTV